MEAFFRVAVDRCRPPTPEDVSKEKRPSACACLRSVCRTSPGKHNIRMCYLVHAFAGLQDRRHVVPELECYPTLYAYYNYGRDTVSYFGTIETPPETRSLPTKVYFAKVFPSQKGNTSSERDTKRVLELELSLSCTSRP